MVRAAEAAWRHRLPHLKFQAGCATGRDGLNRGMTWLRLAWAAESRFSLQDAKLAKGKWHLAVPHDGDGGGRLGEGLEIRLQVSE
jgi:hypothetical protein